MRFTQYYLGCLSQASYLIGDETTERGAVVDPRRDVREYLEAAAAAGLRVEYVIETHVHADFLSGHLELAAATGATVIYGAGADVRFPHRQVSDGERLDLGSVVLEFRATPGHTPESISIVVWETPDAVRPYGVLTGDTLSIGDVGRPDLLTSHGHSPEDMARQLYRSLHTRLLWLPDATRVYPAHGAGSACGKNLSTETVSTIGEQHRTNYALRLGTGEEFVAAVTDGQPPRPDYFARVAEVNREPHRLFLDDQVPGLSLGEVLGYQARGAVVLDACAPEAFCRGHLRRSLNVGLDGRFAEHAGEVIDVGEDIAVVCDPGRGHEARVRLSRVGLDAVLGALDQPALAFESPRTLGKSSFTLRARRSPAGDREFCLRGPSHPVHGPSQRNGAAAVAVTVAVSGWACLCHQDLPGAVTAPCPVPGPPPNPIAAEPDGRRVLSRGGAADHAVTPQAPLTGSGCREYSYGGFGGGHHRFHPHAPGLLIRRSMERVRRVHRSPYLQVMVHSYFVPGVWCRRFVHLSCASRVAGH